MDKTKKDGGKRFFKIKLNGNGPNKMDIGRKN
jgi:hypothetical protein